ncbi:Lipopolysaccharide biosynthesis protein WzxC [Novipirellula aureliae]|uniref:Lipopolysaccharide biosynthesis protein WzxC n=1 Tax=Novipirellula aureliae TaxID=2527966 RepID=A0A5C6DP51_9BACT|nr:Lipopolysaccharide biosynthesis protein WzxC [Novipirellula aureliae]
MQARTISGVLWNFGEQLAGRGIGIAVQLLLARLLVPEDYGLVAMMAVFIAVGNSLMDSGFTQALIRLPDAKQVDFNTAFYSNLCLGLLSYALLFVSAPLVANFYDEPRLVLLIRIASLSILIGSFQVVQLSHLAREINFRLKVWITLPSGIVAGLLAVILAALGFGVWALVAQTIIASLLKLILLWSFQKWRPTLSFSRNSFKTLYSFGCKLFASSLLDTIFNNVYVIVIAKMFSTPLAGLYFFADRLQRLVIQQLFMSITTVTYPALAMVQDDNQRLKMAYRKILLTTSFVVFPVLMLMAALAEPLFEFLLEEKWLPAAPMLRLMCVAALFYPLSSLNLNILKVKGRSDLFLGLEIIKKILISVVLLVSVRYGITGILYGRIFTACLAFAPNSYYSIELLGYSLREQIRDVFPSLCLSLVIGIVSYQISIHVDWHSLSKLILLGVLSTTAYLSLAKLFRFEALSIVTGIFFNRIQLLRRPKTTPC